MSPFSLRYTPGSKEVFNCREERQGNIFHWCTMLMDGRHISWPTSVLCTRHCKGTCSRRTPGVHSEDNTVASQGDGASRINLLEFLGNTSDFLIHYKGKTFQQYIYRLRVEIMSHGGHSAACREGVNSLRDGEITPTPLQVHAGIVTKAPNSHSPSQLERCGRETGLVGRVLACDSGGQGVNS